MSAEPVILDALGTFCPIPIIRLNEFVQRCAPGTLIEVRSDDEGAKVDIPVWCRMKHHEFLGREDLPQGWAFLVRVAQDTAST